LGSLIPLGSPVRLFYIHIYTPSGISPWWSGVRAYDFAEAIAMATAEIPTLKKQLIAQGFDPEHCGLTAASCNGAARSRLSFRETVCSDDDQTSIGYGPIIPRPQRKFSLLGKLRSKWI
jgi:hypothetical protein